MALGFTSMNALGITIAGEAYPHLLCHCVLTYSNWEWCTPCQSESLLALRRELQESLFRIGHTPGWLWTDSSTAATHTPGARLTAEYDPAGKRVFNERYLEMLTHYGNNPRVITLGAPHENGDVESLNGALKNRVRQYLLLRGHRDFDSLEEYHAFLASVLDDANSTRQARINYRHINDSLVSKPGALRKYRHREELFPSPPIDTLARTLRLPRNRAGIHTRGGSRYERALELRAVPASYPGN